MRIVAWYKSWFCTSGTLDPKAYVKHVIAAHAFFFGFGFLGIGLFFLVTDPLIALHAPAWATLLPLLVVFPLWFLALGSWAGILIVSTMRFVRHLMQG
jgi:hypothetical protein